MSAGQFVEPKGGLGRKCERDSRPAMPLPHPARAIHGELENWGGAVELLLPVRQVAVYPCRCCPIPLSQAVVRILEWQCSEGRRFSLCKGGV